MEVTQKPWADGPFELIPSSRVGSKKGESAKGSKGIAEEMIIVHNFLLRGINSIYLQCINVEKSPDPADVRDFVQYSLEWGHLVHEHHEGEETIFFPDIERMTGVPGLMGNNVEQHQAFYGGLEAYETYLKAVQEGKEKYDGVKLKGIIDSFMPVLREHLYDEIGTLLELEKYEDAADWGKWFQQRLTETMQKANDPNIKTTAFPLVLTNRDKTFDDGVYSHWPPVPWFVMILMKWVFIPKKSHLWRFSSCDSNGVPKELPFA